MNPAALPPRPARRARDPFEGPRLLGWIAAAVLAGCGLALAAAPGEDGVRLAIRLTARFSLALFLITFTASAAARHWPGDTTAWLLRQRRWVGLGFAFSHSVHLVAIIAFARIAPTDFRAVTMPAQYVTGGIAYLFVAAMAATSFDRAVAWLGARRWRRLHLCGQWYLWVSFVVAFGKRVPGMGGYLLPIALLLAALVMRLTLRRSARPSPLA